MKTKEQVIAFIASESESRHKIVSNNSSGEDVRVWSDTDIKELADQSICGEI